jgi:hypothetical protein
MICICIFGLVRVFRIPLKRNNFIPLKRNNFIPLKRNNFFHRRKRFAKGEVFNNFAILTIPKKDFNKKQKSFRAPTKWRMERRGKGSCGIQRPKCQDLRAAAAAAPFITQKRSETRNVDLANKIRRNDYLRQVDHRCTHIAIDRTGSLKYMSD